MDELELLDLDEEMEEKEPKRSLYDICFHLLKLYSDRFVSTSLVSSLSIKIMSMV